MNETELVSRILSGEESLFAQIVTRYSGYVWAICSSYVKNPSECEDVAQEVFVQCYQRLDTLRNPRALGSWLSQLARSRCLMWLRASERRGQRESRYEEMGAALMAEDASPVREELHEAIRNAVELLPAAYREALLLRFAEGYPVDEAASFLGISSAALRKRLERGQGMLRDMMSDQMEAALGKRKHKDAMASGVIAAIPFGTAPWLGVAGAGSVAAGSVFARLAHMGGVAAMSKKIALGVGAVVFMLGAVYTAVQVAKPSHPGAKSAAVVEPRRPQVLPPEAVASSPSVNTAPPKPQEDATGQPVSAPVTTTASRTPTVSPLPAKPPLPASISGHIYGKGGNPLAGAEVFLEVGRGVDRNDVAGHYTAKTGADGKYRIAEVTSFGPSLAYACADGFTMAFNAFTVSAGTNLKDVDVTLEPAAYFVAGKVVNESGAPVPEASVDCMYYAYDKEGLVHTAMTGQTTGNIGGTKLVFARAANDGSFKISIPSAGLCDFRVVKDGYGTGFFAQIPTSKEDAEFVLKQGGAIAGKVFDTKGQPLPGTVVHVAGEVLPGGLSIPLAKISPLPVPPVNVTTDADGAYVAEGLGEDYTYTVAVPGVELVEIEQLPSENGLQTIARMMNESDQSMFGGNVQVRKTGIHVKAAQTTSNVDLVLGAITSATLHGKVTDHTSGQPVCPVVITASSFADGVDDAAKDYFHAKSGASAVSRLDGTYVLRIANLTHETHFTIGHLFMTEGGSSWEQPEEALASLDLSPGDERELDLIVDAPIAVPVRYVSLDGTPREGISAGIREAGNGGACGGTLISDAEGRVVFHGIRPGVSLQALAWIDVGSQTKTVGESEPFTGDPGRTVTEVIVTCRLSGGIEGVLTYPDGRVVADTPLACGAQGTDGAFASAEGSATTDASGRFYLPDSLPEGSYQGVVLGFVEHDSSVPYSGTAANVEIAPDAMSDLGTLVVKPEKDLLRVVAAAGYDHKSNEAIAGLYSPDWLDRLPDSGALLKTGFALYDMERYAEALDVFQRMAQAAESDPTDKAIAIVWQGHMLDLLGRRLEAINTYAAAAEMNVTGTIRHDQFGLAYAPSREAEQRTHEPFQRVENQER